MVNSYDVLVAGAGPAGLCAAVQAARAGARTLLVEKTGVLGGTTVTGGVNFPGLFHAWGKQVIAGIGWDLVSQAVRESGGAMPDFSDDDRPHYRRQIWIERFAYAALADAMARDCGVDVLLHTLPIAAQQNQDSWRVQLAGKEGAFWTQARVLIDATGDANLVSLAGGPTRRSEKLQPGTLVFRASGYELANLDLDCIVEATRRAIESGELQASDVGGRAESVCVLLRNCGGNILHITDIDARTSRGKTEAEFKGREALLRVQRFLRRQAGLEKFYVQDFAPECGIRETVTIEGETEVTVRDYQSGRVWEDAVCYSFYPIDVHEDNGIDTRHLRWGICPTLPLRAMLPRGTRNLLAAGRIACGDKEAHSAFRVQASCMAMGQAVGGVAALAAQKGCEVREVPLTDLRNLLQQHGAIVPPANQK